MKRKRRRKKNKETFLCGHLNALFEIFIFFFLDFVFKPTQLVFVCFCIIQVVNMYIAHIIFAQRFKQQHRDIELNDKTSDSAHRTFMHFNITLHSELIKKKINERVPLCKRPIESMDTHRIELLSLQLSSCRCNAILI